MKWYEEEESAGGRIDIATYVLLDDLYVEKMADGGTDLPCSHAFACRAGEEGDGVIEVLSMCRCYLNDMSSTLNLCAVRRCTPGRRQAGGRLSICSKPARATPEGGRLPAGRKRGSMLPERRQQNLHTANASNARGAVNVVMEEDRPSHYTSSARRPGLRAAWMFYSFAELLASFSAGTLSNKTEDWCLRNYFQIVFCSTPDGRKGSTFILFAIFLRFLQGTTQAASSALFVAWHARHCLFLQQQRTQGQRCNKNKPGNGFTM